MASEMRRPAFLRAHSSFFRRWIAPEQTPQAEQLPKKSSREKRGVGSREASVTEAIARSSGLWHRLLRVRGSLPLAPQNRVQFSAEEQEQTGKIHPGHQHDDGGERQVGRVIPVVFRDVKLENFRDHDPTDRKANGAR